MPLNVRHHLLCGQVIPALPLALDARRAWDHPRQQALIRSYLDAGAGGLAVGVNSTQFEIRDPQHGRFEPILRLASVEIDAWNDGDRPFTKIAGLCGETAQAAQEAATARTCGFHAGLLSLAALNDHP